MYRLRRDDEDHGERREILKRTPLEAHLIFIRPPETDTQSVGILLSTVRRLAHCLDKVPTSLVEEENLRGAFDPPSSASTSQDRYGATLCGKEKEFIFCTSLCPGATYRDIRQETKDSGCR